MIVHPVDRVVDKLRDMGRQPKQSSPGQWDARCPVEGGHKNGDKDPSLSVGTGSEGKVLICCQKGCKTPDIARALGLDMVDLFPPKQEVRSTGPRITSTYDYYDEGGVRVFQVVRYTPKGFKQRQQDDRGVWVWTIKDIDVRPLYLLPQVRRAIDNGQRIWMTEGEKDAEALQWAVDGATTCNSGGAGKWRPEYAEQLAGAKRITLVRDNDDKGLEHVKLFATKLLEAGFGDIEVVAPPAPFKDAAEALGAGRTPDDFVHEWDNSESTSWLIMNETATEAPEDEVVDEDEAPTKAAEIGADWAPIDLISIARQIADGTYQPTVPTILAVDGSIPLFYRERINLLFGESGGGKTWLALAAVAEVALSGQRVLFIDYEDNPNGIAERLVNLGLPFEAMRYIDYRNPSTSILVGADTLEGLSEVYSLVVLDSTGEAMAAGGVNGNDDGEVAQWFALVKRLLRLPGKPGIITLDHVPKNQEGQLLFSIGSQRKRAAITGASYRVDTVKEAAKGQDGKLKLTVAKDRPGNRQRGSTACHVELKSINGDGLEITAALESPSVTADGKFRPTIYMERVSRWLEDNPGATAREVREGVTGKTTVVNEALAALVHEGHIRVTSGGRNAQLHTVTSPYREDSDVTKKAPQTSSGSLVPSGSSRFPGTTQDAQTSSGSLVPSGSSRFPGTTDNTDSEWFPGSHPLSGNREPLGIAPKEPDSTVQLVPDGLSGSQGSPGAQPVPDDASGSLPYSAADAQQLLADLDF
jgi:hypothetical protein